jgi:hypothetical protein
MAIVAALASVLLLPAGAMAGWANGGLRGASAQNPLQGIRWGHYTGAYDGVYSTFAGLRGQQRALLAQIAMRPTVHWFGAWVTDAAGAARRYISETTGGDPDVLSQIAVFRLDPWEGAACGAFPGGAATGAYHRWIDGFARGIGDARVALILQPDLPFALCSPGRRRYLAMVAFAARRVSALRHTTVYLDAGARYWPPIGQAAAMLEAAGVRYARGFALNDTEYDSTSAELRLGAEIAGRLAADGVRGKHLVINTAENGAPFLNGQYHGDVSNPRVCRSRHDTVCATLGIPPTTDTANPRWHLGRRAQGIAARLADAYLWVGRPWLVQGSGPFDLRRALGLIKSSPF